MRTVVIFGATSGLGWELAKLFFNLGWNLCLFGRRGERLLGFKSVYCENDPSRCLIYTGDITQNECVHEFLRSSLMDYSRIDLLIVSSAIYSAESQMDNETNWRSVMETNFWGTFRVISSVKKIAPHEGAKPVVIALSSSLARRPVMGSGPYSASKSAMEIFIKAWNAGEGNGNAVVDVVTVPPFKSEMNRVGAVSAAAVAARLVEKITKKYFEEHITQGGKL